MPPPPPRSSTCSCAPIPLQTHTLHFRDSAFADLRQANLFLRLHAFEVLRLLKPRQPLGLSFYPPPLQLPILLIFFFPSQLLHESPFNTLFLVFPPPQKVCLLSLCPIKSISLFSGWEGGFSKSFSPFERTSPATIFHLRWTPPPLSRQKLFCFRVPVDQPPPIPLLHHDPKLGPLFPGQVSLNMSRTKVLFFLSNRSSLFDHFSNFPCPFLQTDPW